MEPFISNIVATVCRCLGSIWATGVVRGNSNIVPKLESGNPKLLVLAEDEQTAEEGSVGECRLSSDCVDW